MVLLSGVAFGQNPAPTVPDSVLIQPLPASLDSLNVLAADTVELTPQQNARIRKIIPKKSTVLSAVLPGLGQIHNGHWWKVPIIYAGFGTLGYFANYYSKEYRTYRRYGILAYNDPSKETEVEGISRKVGVAQLERAARAYARYRDYNFLGMALLWGVNVIEANVTAHLKTFDISEDLTLNVKPSILMPATGMLPVPGVRVAFHFKK
ncbi:hypothetical protein GCM10027347_42710 [Larkinella harenae]